MLSNEANTPALRQDLEARIERMLPPRYQHCSETVKPTSMGSAGLKYAPDGLIAWGEIWTSFCDLALAGGPPHRGRLLEPVPPESLRADPERYRQVVAELGRAIRATSFRDTVPGYEPGWVGIPCGSRGEAAWLQAAVTAENVSARRRGDTLQLPAGPDFRFDKEVKNVAVALAKVCHYWDGHLNDTQEAAFADVALREPASATEIARDPEGYRSTVALLLAALEDATDPGVDPTGYPGWLGIPCGDELEAAWRLRASLVAGCLARREAEVLYLAVGVGASEDESLRVARESLHIRDLWRVSG